MKYRSTRGRAPQLSLGEAIRRGVADDGGLYVPVELPRFSMRDFEGLTTLREIAARWLAPFFTGDAQAEHLQRICDRALSFPIPLKRLDQTTCVLELFHGPTAAFKDVGARFLAEYLSGDGVTSERTVLVATSGDTGGAVAGAFHRRPGFRVVVLFPKGRVSQRQEKQLTAWGDNVRALAVRGDFDACQRMVKEAFADSSLAKRHGLISANSINLGRLLPQAAYYAAAAVWHGGAVPTVFIPSGNLGNATGAMWARRTGMPLGKIVLAVNANRPVLDYFEGGEWAPRPTVSTLANAMDVGNPSNMERVRDLYPDRAEMLKDLAALGASDEQIRLSIGETFQEYGEIVCPHTAVAMYARAHYATPAAIVVATAHPAKFETIVEPIVGRKVPVPPELAVLLARPSQATEVEATIAALKNELSHP
jgi:threonine synthase